MAYMNQERKAEIAAKVKPILKRYGVKATLSTDRSAISLNIKSASIDFIANYNGTVAAQPGGFRNGSPAEKSIQVNTYWFQEHFSGKAKKFLTEVLKEMNRGNHDRSDSQSDYFDVGWYVYVNIGKWNKPFVVEE
jgi:hypothetical protein